MKSIRALVISSICFYLVACSSTRKSGAINELRSEQEYAAGQEALAQDLLKTGQATSIQDARTKAAAAANADWARSARATKSRSEQKKLEKDLSDLDRPRN